MTVATIDYTFRICLSVYNSYFERDCFFNKFFHKILSKVKVLNLNLLLQSNPHRTRYILCTDSLAKVARSVLAVRG